MEDKKQEKQKIRTSTKWAIGVTTVWLIGVAAYVIFKWDKFLTMEPNAIGDFLAGTMSPLALFWLVAGYRQQGEELRLNTEALQAQLKELALQVESTKVIAENSTEQAKITKAMHEFNLAETARLHDQGVRDHLRNIKPNIYVTVRVRTGNRWEMLMRNVGGDAFRLKASSGHFQNCVIPGDLNRLAREGELAFTLNTPFRDKQGPFVTVGCWDSDDNFHETKYEYDEVTNRITAQVLYEPDSEDD